MKYIGEKYNRLTVMHYFGATETTSKTGKNRIKYLARVKCDCGNERTVVIGDIRNGKTKSCGCYIKDYTSKRSLKHGLVPHPLYRVWGSIKKRAFLPSGQNNPNYGGRGITMCDEWANDFNIFYNWSIANGYAPKLQIDRKDVDGGYCPENCRYVTSKVNSNNKRNTVYLTLNDETKPIAFWAEIKEIGIETLRRRIFLYSWSHERALTTPVKPHK